MLTPDLPELLQRTTTWMTQASERYRAQRTVTPGKPQPLIARPALELGATRDLARAWMAAYPATVTFQDRQVPVAALPPEVTELAITVDISFKNGTIYRMDQTWLDWLVDDVLATGAHSPETAAWREVFVWACLSGMDPNRYNGQATPINRMAMNGRVDVLTLLKDAGADLVMALTAKHVASHAPPAREGSTLLHRLIQAANRLPENAHVRRDDLLRSVTFLAEQVPGSMTPDVTGWNPVDAAQGDFKTVLVRVEAAPRVHARQAKLADRPATVRSSRQRS